MTTKGFFVSGAGASLRTFLLMLVVAAALAIVAALPAHADSAGSSPDRDDPAQATDFAAGVSGELESVQPVSITHSSISFGQIYTYTGKPVMAAPIVAMDGARLQEGVDYSLGYLHNIDAGIAFVRVVGKGRYTGTVYAPFVIRRAAQKLEAEPSYGKLTFTRAALAKGYRTVFAPIDILGAMGSVCYENASTSRLARQVKVSRTTGNLKLPKTFKAKNLIVTLKVRASGNANYLPTEKTVNVTVCIGNKKRCLASIAFNEWRRGVADKTYGYGGKRYWKLWYKKRVAWCSEFASWCCLQTGLKPGVTLPKRPVNAKVLYSFFSRHSNVAVVHVNRKNSYRPKVGDIAHLGKLKGKRYEPVHTGIVVRVANNGFQTVEGNAGDKVKMRTYSFKDYKKWRYFVTLK